MVTKTVNKSIVSGTPTAAIKPKRVANPKVSASSDDYRVISGQRRRQKTEAKIIEAALGVFAEKGKDAPVIDDFIKAAGVARGTFYNFYKNTDDLLAATSKWLTSDLAESIEEEVRGIKDPALRHGVAVRLWMRMAASDQAWCGFVVRIWYERGFAREAPLRDIRLGIKSGVFSCVSAECGLDMTLGTIRQAMSRMIDQKRLNKKIYCEQIVETILAGLGASAQKRKEVADYPLPEMRRPPKTLMFAVAS